MNRGLLLLLLSLLAVAPPRVCTCPHAHHVNQPDHHDDDCPCSCHTPRESYTAPRAADALPVEVGFDSPVAALTHLVHIPPVFPVIRCGEPPPGQPHPSVPLFLAVSRLLM